jgi:hypothetical protein
MKIAALAFSAALLGFASLTPASALPASAIGQTAAQNEGVTLVAQKIVKRKIVRKNGKTKIVKKVKYRAGGRYSKAPRGWHRHSKRPVYWRTRSCIMVGPLWYCP